MKSLCVAWPFFCVLFLAFNAFGLSTYNPEAHYPEFVRLSLMGAGGPSLIDFAPETTDGGSPNTRWNSGAILFDFGHRYFTFQTGLQALQFSILLGHKDSASKLQTASVAATYVGIPLLMRLNYIEHPTAVFSLKAGIMPSFLFSPDNNEIELATGTNRAVSISLRENEAFALIGFTGSSPLTRTMGLLVDLTLAYGLNSPDGSGNHSAGILLGTGFAFGF